VHEEDDVSAGPVRVALVAASPVYYQAPLYRRLAADPRLDFTAIFASSEGVRPGDFGYGEPIAFDTDALGGFESKWLRRANRTPAGSGRFFALRDPDVVLELLRGRYEVVWLHGYYSFTHVAAALTQRLRGRPLLVRDDQTLLTPRPLLKRVLKHGLFRTVLGGAIPLPVGSENERWFRHYGLRASAFRVPNCVDGERLAEAEAAARPRRRELARALRIDPDAGPVIVTVGRLVSKKQPELLLEAFARVRSRRRCTLLVVGSGPLEADLRARVARDGIEDVVFAGFLNQSRIADAYVCADVFALLSKADETWGLVVNEAMSFGLPLVLSDRVGASADLLEDGVNGYTVGADDVDAVVERLERLLGDAALRAQLGAASRARIAEWTHERAADGVIAALAHAVGADRWARVQTTPRRLAATEVAP
jgi:glycosyltransferase involved in cell wall biosynthesis